MHIKCVTILALVVAIGSGCGPTVYQQRQAEIDAAYKRGEITFAQKEQMTGALEQQRQQAAIAALQATQIYQQQYQQQLQAQQQNQSQMIYPQQPSYDVYDTRSNKIGTLRPR